MLELNADSVVPRLSAIIIALHSSRRRNGARGNFRNRLRTVRSTLKLPNYPLVCNNLRQADFAQDVFDLRKPNSNESRPCVLVTLTEYIVIVINNNNNNKQRSRALKRARLSQIPSGNGGRFLTTLSHAPAAESVLPIARNYDPPQSRHPRPVISSHPTSPPCCSRSDRLQFFFFFFFFSFFANCMASKLCRRVGRKTEQIRGD